MLKRTRMQIWHAIWTLWVPPKGNVRPRTKSSWIQEWSRHGCAKSRKFQKIIKFRIFWIFTIFTIFIKILKFYNFWKFLRFSRNVGFFGTRQPPTRREVPYKGKCKKSEPVGSGSEPASCGVLRRSEKSEKSEQFQRSKATRIKSSGPKWTDFTVGSPLGVPFGIQFGDPKRAFLDHFLRWNCPENMRKSRVATRHTSSTKRRRQERARRMVGQGSHQKLYF